MENWKISIKDVGYKTEREVYIYRKVINGIEIFRGDRTEIISEHSATTPSFNMTPEMLQEFANELDKNGINPKQGFVEGKLEATEKHLEDMRTLVFNNK